MPGLVAREQLKNVVFVNAVQPKSKIKLEDNLQMLKGVCGFGEVTLGLLEPGRTFSHLGLTAQEFLRSLTHFDRAVALIP